MEEKGKTLPYSKTVPNLCRKGKLLTLVMGRIGVGRMAVP